MTLTVHDRLYAGSQDLGQRSRGAGLRQEDHHQSGPGPVSYTQLDVYKRQAVFLSKAAAPGVRNVVVTAVELLSGIPSVVFGLLGMQVLVPAVAKVFGKA